MSRKDVRVSEIPTIVTDPKSKKRYQKGKFLGKGGFAKCYELTDMDTKEIFAGKIVSKSLLTKQHQREKMTQEIAIHRSVNHKHIVGFHDYFEDYENVYILLELCRRRSLMEMHKRRRACTEPEVRYFIHQIVLACDYLHKRNIIHRDLKLGNLFINNEMEIKIGDFGLATKVQYDGERKKTLCGTPNYIAPEVLGKKGHSFEVDSWSLGCIVYTLLLGKPPFETSCLGDTYQRIRKNEYTIPTSRVSNQARALIQRLLQAEPARRPTMEQVLADEFFTSGFMPNALPTSCLTMAPRFDAMKSADARKPLVEVNGVSERAVSGKEDGIESVDTRPTTAKPSTTGEEPADCYLGDLNTQLAKVLESKPLESAGVMNDDCEDPAAIPIYWVSKWVDYSDKYGLGYQLCDNSVGVLFNDSTRLLLLANGENVQYIERNGLESYHTMRVFPRTLTKKITLMKYFRNYMSEHLVKAGGNAVPREADQMTRLPFLRTWFRTRSAIVLHLSNGTMQINFFQDHTKVILCPLMQCVTYIDEFRHVRTFTFELIEKHGCSKELASRLRYARTMVDRLLQSKSSSGKVRSASAQQQQPSAPAEVVAAAP